MVDAASHLLASSAQVSDVLAVHTLDHIALSVPDLAVGERFYSSFGLSVTNVPTGLEAAALQGTVVRLREAARRRLDRISFHVSADSAQAFRRRLEREGIALVDPPYEVTGDGLWFHDPDGILVEVMVRARRGPSAKSDMDVSIAPEGVRRAPQEFGVPISPRRIGHVMIFVVDVSRSITFYERFLGMRLSDRSGDTVAFMHTPHGSDHHLIAFVRSSRPGFHHASFEVPSIDTIGRGAMRMAESGYREGWGFGRHEAGSNFFHYVRDPWGSFAEYFCDMDFIPAGCAWEPRDIPPEYGLALWHPPVPSYFLENFEDRS